jgi:hypothetical protein
MDERGHGRFEEWTGVYPIFVLGLLEVCAAMVTEVDAERGLAPAPMIARKGWRECGGGTKL